MGEKMEAEGVIIASVGVSRGKKGLQIEEFVPLAYHSYTGNHFLSYVFSGGEGVGRM